MLPLPARALWTPSRWIVLVCVGVPLGACAHPPLERFEYRQLHMGTEARLVLYATTPAAADAAASAAFARIGGLDRVLSDYRMDSELSGLAAAAGESSIAVSDDLLRVLRHALDIARETAGAFDPTAGPLSVVWREARRARRLPADTALARARSLVGWWRVSVDAGVRTVRLDATGMRLDLGGIAKGFAADEALAVLRAHGTARALVAIGGEIVVGHPPPGRAGWPIAVGSMADTIELVNAAVSSSGDTEQFVEIDGVRYSHVLDPRTGRPLTSRLAATVVASDGMTADAFATVVTVLDPAARAAFMARHTEARFHLLYSRPHHGSRRAIP